MVERFVHCDLCSSSAVDLGYFEDPFVRFFVSKPHRRAPLINRGYYSRVACFDTLIKQFVGCASSASSSSLDERASVEVSTQIVSLGAGCDTTFFRLNASGQMPPSCRYFEVDHDPVTRAKVNTIRRHPELQVAAGLHASTLSEPASLIDQRGLREEPPGPPRPPGPPGPPGPPENCNRPGAGEIYSERCEPCNLWSNP